MMDDQTAREIPPPARPPGWEDAAEQVYTINSPDGGAVAWICPEIGGNAIAYAVRLGEQWVQVLDVAPSPAVLRDVPSRYGLPILFPFPGGMRGGRYRCAGREYSVPPTYPTGSDPDGANIVIHGFAHIRPWRFVEQSANRIVCEFVTPDALDESRKPGYPFRVRLTHEISLSPDGLRSVLVAENRSSETAPLAFGLHPYFGAGVLGPDRSNVRVELPGRSARAREVVEPGRPPAMTGRREPAPADPIAIVPQGERMGVSRTDFPPAPVVARITGLPPIDGRDGWTVTLSLDAGYQDLFLFAPPVQTSISLEPQTQMMGAVSLPEGDPEGLQGLAPGATRSATAVIRLVPPAGDGGGR